MGTSRRTVHTPRIPRYILDLNSLAESHGITPSVLFIPLGNEPGTRLCVKWRGTCQQLQSAGFATRHQLARMMLTTQRHRSLRSFMHTVPSSEPPWGNPLLQGEFEMLGDRFEWSLDFGLGHFSISDRGGVETITYAEEVRRYGTAEALFRLGIGKPRLPLGVRAAKGSRLNEPWWHCRRMPNGLYLYCSALEAALRSLRSAKPHLRLVVDNTLGKTRL